MLEDLDGKVALVTGASSGLGRVFCEDLVRHGCHVVAAARRTHLLETLELHLNRHQPPTIGTATCSSTSPKNGSNASLVSTVVMDVSGSEADIEEAVQLAWNAFGRIDVLINNAGFRGSIKSAVELDEEEWNKVMTTDLKGVWLVSKAVAKRFTIANISGSIINISSIAALQRGLLPGAAAYATAKAGGNHLTKMMALELGKDGIRVNSIAPGLFLSEITADLLSQEWVKSITPQKVPMQRNGIISPDLTSLVLLLASDCSKYVTGNVFVVDGGQSIQGLHLRSLL